MPRRFMRNAAPLHLVAVAGLLAACSTGPGFGDDSRKEDAMSFQPQFSTPAKPIRVAFDVIRHDVRFEGAAVLGEAGVADLSETLAGYHLDPSDTVRIVPFGDQSRALADRRLTGVSTAIVNLGFVPVVGDAVEEPQEGAGVAILIGRWGASVPGCPDWSQPAGSTYDNRITSNFGCADAINLAAMIEDPRDLLRGRPYTGTAAGLPASAVSVYGAARGETADETQPIVGRFTTITAGGEDD
ncbi:MAG: CpaD family pilus assembly protein [Alphaproteobacteria bacterium]|nr:CpaD family pilus assembly protein [Alphaproteobacteria bacterium]